MNLNLLNNTIDVINLAVAFHCFLIALGQMLVKEKKWLNYLVAVMFLSYGMIRLEFVLLVTGYPSMFLNLFALSWPFHFWIMPAAWLYVKILVNPAYQLNRKDFLYFLPGLILFILLIPVLYTKGADEKMKYVIGDPSPDTTFYFITFCYISIVVFKTAFVILMFKETSFVWNRERLKNVFFFRIMVFICIELIFAFLFNFIGIILGSDLILRLNSLFFNQIVFTPFILSYRYPNLLHSLTVEISREKYRRSQVKGLEIDSVVRRLTDLLEIEKIYTDPELKIGAVSDMLNISSHQLSEIINKKLKVNFRTLINQYRIEESKRLMIENPDDNILKIAYAVGFNSKTAFNNTFSNFASMTPSEYRQKI